MLSALSPCPLVPENSAAAAVALASGPLADIALCDILGHGRGCARRGVAEATPARLDDAHALAGRQLVDGFGMHPHPIDRVFAQRSVAAAKQAARGEQRAVAPAERGDELPGIVAQDHLLAETAAPLAGTAGVRQQALALDGCVGERFPHLHRHGGHV